MPAASPLQSVAAAWVGAVAHHDISSTSASRRLSPPDHRTIEGVDDEVDGKQVDGKYLHRIAHLCVIQTLISTPPTPSPRADSESLAGRGCAREVGIVVEER
jgi:hypothetical protein